MNYKYTEKKVKIGGREFRAIFPKKHSRVEGLIFECRDANACDSYANIVRWVRFFYIKEKGTKEWKMIENQHPDYKWAVCGMGWHSVLLNLESPKVKEKIALEEEIRELNHKIKYDTEELKRLEKRYKELTKNG